MGPTLLPSISGKGKGEGRRSFPSPIPLHSKEEVAPRLTHLKPRGNSPHMQGLYCSVKVRCRICFPEHCSWYRPQGLVSHLLHVVRGKREGRYFSLIHITAQETSGRATLPMLLWADLPVTPTMSRFCSPQILQLARDRVSSPALTS